jgi:O-antigen/teichoic acid export membrane protein
MGSNLARNSGWMFLGNGVKLLTQAGYFILIARSLGPSEYGAFVGVVALIGLLAPFAGIGSGNLLVKNVARDPTLFREYWGNALFISAVTGTILVGLVMVVSRWVLVSSISALLVLLISLADLLAVKSTEIGSQAFLSVDELKYTAVLTVFPYVLRLFAVFVLLGRWHRATAILWAWFYLGCAVIAALVAISVTIYKLGPPKLALWRIRDEFAEGFYFGTSLSAQTVYNDIDKSMLARFSTLDATGIYGAAYRLIDVAFVPVRSVLFAAYADFFRHGKDGIAKSYAYAKKILPKVVGYSFLVSVVLFLCAPLIPRILGSSYSASVEALRWLALLPVFKSLHYFMADSLTGAGYQRVRTTMQIAVALFNVGLNLWLIPAYSWRGASWSSLASDGTLALLMYISVLTISAKESRLASAADTQRKALRFQNAQVR